MLVDTAEGNFFWCFGCVNFFCEDELKGNLYSKIFETFELVYGKNNFLSCDVFCLRVARYFSEAEIMAINQTYLDKKFIRERVLRKSSDKNLYLLAGILFPLIVFVGYFKTYYFSAYFDVPRIANNLVHLHGIVMSLWVLYFTAQVALARTKNIKLHITLGFAGIGLAALVVAVGLATAYDSHVVRHVAPAGINPYSFLIIPLGDLVYFVGAFAAAIYYRKRPAEHKALMLMTAINFAAPALARIPVVAPDYLLLWAFGFPCVLAIVCLAWNTYKNRKLNKVLAIAVTIFVIAQPVRIVISGTETWVNLMTKILG